MLPPVSLCNIKSLLHSLSLSLRLLVTCGHVCMTKEMQSLAQTITICLVCTIYMKYIFIHDMQAHEIAPLCFFPSLSYAFSLCAVQKVSEMKTLVSFMSYKVAFYLPYFTHKRTWLKSCSLLLLLQERVQQLLI